MSNYLIQKIELEIDLSEWPFPSEGTTEGESYYGYTAESNGIVALTTPNENLYHYRTSSELTSPTQYIVIGAPNITLNVNNNTVNVNVTGYPVFVPKWSRYVSRRRQNCCTTRMHH